MVFGSVSAQRGIDELDTPSRESATLDGVLQTAVANELVVRIDNDKGRDVEMAKTVLEHSCFGLKKGLKTGHRHVKVGTVIDR